MLTNTEIEQQATTGQNKVLVHVEMWYIVITILLLFWLFEQKLAEFYAQHP